MSILEELVASSWARAEASRAREPEERLLETIRRPVLPFRESLQAPGLSLIAEIKRASPSAGEMDVSLDVPELAESLVRGGACALSVLTEPSRFSGSLEDLRAASGAGVPVLRKDFLVHPYQVAEAWAYGADAVLLIVRALRERTGMMLERAAELGLDALVEVFDEKDVEIVLETEAPIIGINSRDLATLERDPRRFELRHRVPRDRTVVALSGLSERSEMEGVEALGIDGVLVGEVLMRSPDPAQKVAELLGSRS